MTQAQLVSVEVVVVGMGAGGVVQSVSDRMAADSIVAGLEDVRGRQGIPVESTPEIVVGRSAMLLV